MTVLVIILLMQPDKALEKSFMKVPLHPSYVLHNKKGNANLLFCRDGYDLWSWCFQISLLPEKLYWECL